MIRKESKELGKKYDKEQEEEITNTPVLLCPVRLKLKYLHYEKKSGGHLDKEITPLWIPALLTPSGQLLPRENHLPWITRDILEPTTKHCKTIGSMEDLENFLTKQSQDIKNWNELYEYSFKMLRALPYGNLDFDEYHPEEVTYILPDVALRGASTSIVRLLDYLIEKNISTPTLDQYAKLEKEQLKPLITEDIEFKLAIKHFGQMGCNFPLSGSQREALNYFLLQEEGDILAVNGPPGTGKTTLLHSVIASMWVEAAVNESDPPIIIAASTNNQAVTNIINSFGNVLNTENKSEILTQRWLPDINSYGLYCPSKKALEKEENKNFQAVTELWINDFPATSGFPGKVENTEYITCGTSYFLEKCSSFFNMDITEIVKAQKMLHEELVNCLKSIKDTILERENIIKQKNDALKEARKFCFNQELGDTELLNFLLENHNRLVKEKDDIQTCINQDNKTLENIKQKLSTWENLQVMCAHYKKDEPFWLGLLSFIPSIKQKKEERFKNFLRNMNSPYIKDIKENVSSLNLETIFTAIKAQLDIIPKEEQKLRNNISAYKEAFSYKNAEITQVVDLMNKLDNVLSLWSDWNAQKGNKDVLFAKFDMEIRYKVFMLATHYWEARWLLEVRRMQEVNPKSLKGQQKVALKWKRYSMLTPCIVSTLYMLPSLLTYKKKVDNETFEPHPLLKYADLLIIDEAGQVSPEVASASFALTKKALVVGDTLQIEPIWSVGRSVDEGNLINSGIINNIRQYEDVSELGITASEGSVMRVAQKSCEFIKVDELDQHYPERGMFLSEHRRCQNTIISFSNDLAYKGRLIPLAKPIPKTVNGMDILPYMGYAHIPGKSRTKGSSRFNEIEAEVILDWLVRRKSYLEEIYSVIEGKEALPIKKLVAIITPFGAQKNIFYKLIRQNPEYKDLHGITIGTVHALQGAERPIVIFSPVYTEEDNGTTFFFDKGVNMLNVAVSRAKYSFLVFGDMTIFTPKFPKQSLLPSELLATFLFSSEDNEITDINVRPRYLHKSIGEPGLEVVHLLGIDAHRETLANVLESATDQVMIVSPFIRKNAILSDRIDIAIKNAVNRGVTVRVVYDCYLNRRNDTWAPGFMEGLDLLRSVGVKAHEADRIHSKGLYMDKKLMVEGSFNWLSAIRSQSINHPFARLEASFLVKGKVISVFNEVIKHIENKIIN